MKNERQTRNTPPDELDPVQTLPVESMFLPALCDYLKQNERLSVSSLQRYLNIGYAVASTIIEALINMGIVDNSDSKNIGKIVKEKVDLLLPYIKAKQ